MTVCRSCRAPIDWAYTEKGRRIPLDVGLHDDGNLIIGSDGLARVTDERPARRTHFQSCPSAGRHRKPRARSGR